MCPQRPGQFVVQAGRYYCAGVALLAGIGASTACAGSMPAVLMPSLTGTWTLTAADTLYPNGHKVPGFGKLPQGRMMVDADGRYVIEIYRKTARNFRAGVKAAGSADEFKDAMMRTSVHYGSVKLVPSKHQIVFMIEHSVFPNWEGMTQSRDYMLNGDRLVYRVPASATGDGTIAISEWRRLPVASSAQMAPRSS